VVVTHFAPTLHSADPRYGLTPGTAGFCNALDDLLPMADLWLHGHLHCATDLQVGRCRIVANPLGYARKDEQLNFQTGTDRWMWKSARLSGHLRRVNCPLHSQSGTGLTGETP
jgi:hypothetical protein